ncbi:cyclic nucleotide-binding domain-containing protein [Granulosicoccaceae sp. 1_MG-2023]|nr:cyclic nucleotide-binding domain-containing protein [Granulosicoccaceae sp. 1_MG-2023]
MDDEQMADVLKGARLQNCTAGDAIRPAPEQVVAILKGCVRVTRGRHGRQRHAIRMADADKPVMVLPNGIDFSISALSDCQWLQFDRRIIDSSAARREATRPGRLETPMPLDFPSLVSRTQAFRKLSLETLTGAFRLMKRIDYAKGDTVIREGGQADACYLLDTGSADVWQSNPADGRAAVIRRLSAGDSFGEEALQRGGVHKVTVRMNSDGCVLRLAASDFEQVIAPEMPHGITPKEALALINRQPDTTLIDCREYSEFSAGHLPGAHHMSLHELRKRLHCFRRDRPYLLYCHHDLRSRAAVFILREQHINARYIIGGLNAFDHRLPLSTTNTAGATGRP